MKEKIIVYSLTIVSLLFGICFFGFLAVGYIANISNMVDVINTANPTTDNVFIICAKILMHLSGIVIWPVGVILGWIV